jgi:hypothetical protein
MFPFLDSKIGHFLEIVIVALEIGMRMECAQTQSVSWSETLAIVGVCQVTHINLPLILLLLCVELGLNGFRALGLE